MSDINNFSYTDHSDIFKNFTATNKILSALNLFKVVPHDTATFSLDYLTQDDQAADSPVARYGSSFSSTERSKANLHKIEIPHFVSVDNVSPSDWQGQRVPGTGDQMTEDHVLAELMTNQFYKYQRTREKYFIDSLLNNNVNTAFTNESVFNNVSEFGQNQGSAAINFSGLVDVQLDAVQQSIRKSLGAKVEFLKGIVCIASSEFMTSLKSADSVRSQFVYTQPQSNSLLNFREQIPGFQCFDFSNINFINVGGSVDYNSAVPAGSAFFIPVLDPRASVFEIHSSPAARHSDVAKLPGREYYSYVITDDKWKHKEAVFEYGLLPINKLPSCIIKATTTN